MACQFCDDDDDPSLADMLDQGDLMNLAEAIAIGNFDAARQSLEMLFRDDRRAREWVDIGRRRGERMSQRVAHQPPGGGVSHV